MYINFAQYEQGFFNTEIDMFTFFYWWYLYIFIYLFFNKFQFTWLNYLNGLPSCQKNMYFKYH